MKKMVFCLLTAWTGVQALAAGPALTAGELAAAAELVKANGCLSCHAMAEKVVGPAYAKVAAKYQDDQDAVASLAQSIRYGSQGKWGRIPMPAQASLSTQDLNLVARWVLSVPQ